MADIVLVFNAGSTSLKFAAYDIDEARALSPKVSGGVEAIQGSPRFAAQDAEGRVIANHGWTAGRPIGHDQALHFVVEWLQGHLAGSRIVAVGHRMMLGGARHAGPVRIHTRESPRATKTAADRYPAITAAMFRTMRSG